MSDRNTGYGALSVDSNHNPIPSGTGFKTFDNTASPVNSPLSYSSTILAISVPQNAAELVMLPSTAMRFSEDSAMTTYYTVPAATSLSVPVSRTSTVYVVRDASDGVLNLYFVLV